MWATMINYNFAMYKHDTLLRIPSRILLIAVTRDKNPIAVCQLVIELEPALLSVTLHSKLCCSLLIVVLKKQPIAQETCERLHSESLGTTAFR